MAEGRHWIGRYSIASTFYCSGCDSRAFVPLTKWMAENFYSRQQVKTLVRKKHLFMKRHKGRYYVKLNPDNPIDS